VRLLARARHLAAACAPEFFRDRSAGVFSRPKISLDVARLDAGDAQWFSSAARDENAAPHIGHAQLPSSATVTASSASDSPSPPSSPTP
jgi:hypothetical protein